MSVQKNYVDPLVRCGVIEELTNKPTKIKMYLFISRDNGVNCIRKDKMRFMQFYSSV